MPERDARRGTSRKGAAGRGLRTGRRKGSAADHDSPWKEALEHYFEQALALLFPTVHAEVDWSRGHTFLDKELQRVVRDAETGRRYADKLVRVHTRDGAETWLLIHIEVQGEPESTFARRMYTYHHRLHDRYGYDVVSLAVLADTSPDFRPDGYHYGRCGCEVAFRFPAVKLLDWRARWDELEASDNVFAVVVMAQIVAKTVRDGHQRKAWKFHLTRRLLERGYSKGDIMELLRILDWMVQLPRALEEDYRREAYELVEEKRMPYVTTFERAGIQKGRKEGLRIGRRKGRKEGEAAVLLRQMELKFGPLSYEYRQRIKGADAQTLLRWSERVLTAETPEAVFE